MSLVSPSSPLPPTTQGIGKVLIAAAVINVYVTSINIIVSVAHFVHVFMLYVYM